MSIIKGIKAIAVFAGSSFLSHLIVYVVPKAIKGNYPDYLPGSYEYYDQTNFEVSLCISLVVGLVCAASVFRSKQEPEMPLDDKAPNS
jgi:hypothetical protein